MLAVVALATGQVLATGVHASRDEYEVKAAFLLNFARLVEWPDAARPGPRQPIVFSVLGSPEVEAAITRGVGDSVVGDHPVVVKRVSEPGEVGGSHVLFVTRDGARSAGDLLQAARSHAALTVGESEGFAAEGGVINFFTEDRKLRFEINPEAARSAGLKISSRLLRLAVLVGPER